MSAAAPDRGGSLADGGTAHDSLNRRTISGPAAGVADSVLRAVSMYLRAYGQTQDDPETSVPYFKAIAGFGQIDRQRTHPKSEFRSEPRSRSGKDRRDGRARGGISAQQGQAIRVRQGRRGSCRRPDERAARPDGRW